MDIAIIGASILVAALLGFSAHRASICTVRAVAEVLSTGGTQMFRSFGKTVVWTFAATVPVLWLLPSRYLPIDGWMLSVNALSGGFIFGVGAALNGGCAFSTLSRLCDGKLDMVMTLLGFAAGVGLGILFTENGLIDATPPAPGLTDSRAVPIVVSVIGVACWALWEGIRLWRRRPAAVSLTERIGTRRYKLSTAAALIGICSAFLYLVHGPWPYTGVIQGWVESIAVGSGRDAPATILWILFAAVFAGMLMSSWTRDDFHLDWRPTWAWGLKLSGGTLMGLGAALAPGGNDVLILHLIPMLSPHAIVTYGALVLGIAVTLILMQVTFGARMTIRCTGDLCRD